MAQSASQQRYSIKRYAEDKAAGRCVYCHHAPVANNTTTCAPCGRKRAAVRRDQYQSDPAHRARGLQHVKNRYHRLKAAGTCVQCGHAPAVDGQTRCAPCRQYMRDACKAFRESLK